eukprot:g68060.t1
MCCRLCIQTGCVSFGMAWALFYCLAVLSWSVGAWDFFLRPKSLPNGWWLPYQDMPEPPLNCSAHTHYLPATGHCNSEFSGHLLCMSANIERVLADPQGHFVIGPIDMQFLRHFDYQAAFDPWLCYTPLAQLHPSLRDGVLSSPQDSVKLWTTPRLDLQPLLRHATIMAQIYRRPNQETLRALESVPLFKQKYVGLYLRKQDEGDCIRLLKEGCGPFSPPNFQVFPNRKNPQELCSLTPDYIDAVLDYTGAKGLPMYIAHDGGQWDDKLAVLTARYAPVTPSPFNNQDHFSHLLDQMMLMNAYVFIGGVSSPYSAAVEQVRHVMLGEKYKQPQFYSNIIFPGPCTRYGTTKGDSEQHHAKHRKEPEQTGNN